MISEDCSVERMARRSMRVRRGSKRRGSVQGEWVRRVMSCLERCCWRMRLKNSSEAASVWVTSGVSLCLPKWVRRPFLVFGL